MLKKLSLFNFRNHTDSVFDFTERKVVFCGNNGRGKTNILEAISVLSTGKSWREKKGLDLIEYEKEEALIKAVISNDSYEYLLTPRSRTLKRNEKKKSLKSHLGSFPSLLFAPEHLHIFHGTKTERQKFFDRFLSQMYPSYREALSKAQKAARQKSSLLRSQAPGEIISQEFLIPWNTILSETIPIVWDIRAQFLEDTKELLQEELSKVAGNNDDIEIALQSPEDFVPTTEGVLHFFEANMDRERYARKNLLAPSRDDFVFFLRNKPILSTASRGEERSVLLGLLSAQKKYLQNICNMSPILLLDDSFSELDDDRQSHLERLCENSQTFFTTTHEDHFSGFSGEVQKFQI